MHEHFGPVFTYPIPATALSTNPTDLWCVTGSTLSRVAIREIIIGQYSDAGDAQAEMLPIQLWRGSTAIGGGSAITGRNTKGWSGAPTAGSSVTGPSTTLASTASAVVVLADTFNVMGGYRHYPVPAERFILDQGQRFHIRLGAANDALTIHGTLKLQELGKRSG
jgi:hypothetical protein